MFLTVLQEERLLKNFQVIANGISLRLVEQQIDRLYDVAPTL